MFKDRLLQFDEIEKLQTPRPQYWFDMALGKSGIHLSNIFNTDRNELGVRIYIHAKHVEEWLPYFEKHKQQVENDIGLPLAWNPNPENRDKTIGIFKKFDLHDKAHWEGAIEWLADYTLKFRKVFSELIKRK